MTNTAEKPPVNAEFRLQEFKIENCNIDEFAKSKEELDPERILFHHEGSADISTEKSQIAIHLSVRVEYENKNLAEIVTVTDFKIINFEVLKDGDKIEIPGEFWAMLIGLSYSTTRGALIALGEGSYLAKYPMPVINPSALLKKAQEEALP